MIVYQKDGKEYLLLANSSRGVMKISTDGIDDAAGIEAPVRGGGQKGFAVRDRRRRGPASSTSTGSDKEHAVVLRKAKATPGR